MAHQKAVGPEFVELARELTTWMPQYLNLADLEDEDGLYELARWLSTRVTPIDAAEVLD